ncbi:MAG TPA: AraC family transcriptional regulator [Kofleriaceae bacterium]|jgi:AraC-like DNA-binding protein
MWMEDLAERAAQIARVDGLTRHSESRLAVIRRSQPGPARRLELKPVFTLVISGEKRVHTAWKTFSFSSASVLVTSQNMPSVSRVVRATARQPYLSIMLDLEAAIVAPVVHARDKLPVRGITTLADVSEEIVAIVSGLLDTTSRPAEFAVHERELIARLADSEHGLALRAIAARAIPDDLVRAAIREMSANAEKRMSMEQLAARLGTSTSTLHHRFKARTGTSPLQHHKRLRLERARELMRLFAWTAEQTAKEVGYASPAQFNRDYRREFGAPPRRDLSAPID